MPQLFRKRREIKNANFRGKLHTLCNISALQGEMIGVFLLKNIDSRTAVKLRRRTLNAFQSCWSEVKIRRWCQVWGPNETPNCNLKDLGVVHTECNLTPKWEANEASVCVCAKKVLFDVITHTLQKSKLDSERKRLPAQSSVTWEYLREEKKTLDPYMQSLLLLDSDKRKLPLCIV